MKITIERFANKATYTIGRLLIDDVYFCDSLEPYASGVTWNTAPASIRQRKMCLGAMAIPTGEYRIKIAWSPRFQRLMPFLTNVPCFSGVLIHPGNYPKDTRGCILPGWNRRRGMVCGSISAFSEIFARIKSAMGRSEKVTVVVRERWESRHPV